MDQIAITPLARPMHGEIRPPGSKSITNRALVCAALAQGESHLTGALDSEDTRVMVEALQQLGLAVNHDRAGCTIDVVGCGGRLPKSMAELFVANSGTTMRFLTALVALGQGTYRLDGIERMRQRPLQDLADALNELGADIACESPGGCPPVRVNAHGLRGGGAAIRGDVSSQFLSGLLMAAPLADGDVTLTIDGLLVSKPYVTMTLAVMASFGVVATERDLQHFDILGRQRYVGCEYAIEPDASAASYFWGAAAISGGNVTVRGLSRDSLQGDVAFCECLAQMGCDVRYETDAITVQGGPLHGVDVNMNAISDTVQTLAAVALFADGPTVIRDVGHIRHKETDRIGDLACELRKFGARVDETADGLTIHPPAAPQGARIATYNDHRMAMSMALVGLRVPGVTILDPGCTEKTYPAFFDDLTRLGAG